ncbi:MAG: UbiD family decarboxylase [Thermodesulfobacteriota bacterium]
MAEIMFNDLREYIREVKKVDRCKIFEGADWDLEIGTLTEIEASDPNSPLLIFDQIKGYLPGYRVVTNFIHTPRRFALMTGLPAGATAMDLVKAWRQKVKPGFKPIPPVELKTGPIKENVHLGADIDLFEFPAPKWHELDGGRYIGTGHMVVQKDPDEGWVNLGTYRVQVHDRSTATIHVTGGKHGGMIRKKYWDRGLGCPAAVVCGQDPLLWTACSSTQIPWGVSEYDYAGWLRGRPVEVIKGPVTGLPIPAAAEIVLEGEIVRPGTETRDEGPFGEWPGYYAGYSLGPRPEAAFKIKSILHRNDPIILGAPPLVPAIDTFSHGKQIMRAADVWDRLDKEVPGVKGVWYVENVGQRHMVVVSIEQKYGGHAKQTAMALGGFLASAYRNKFVIIVDDDIDPSNINEVLWAMCTRCDPADAIEIIKGCWGGTSDPALPPDKLARRQLEHSKVLIMACKPYHWIKDFPPTTRATPELIKKVMEKWKDVLKR